MRTSPHAPTVTNVGTLWKLLIALRSPRTHARSASRGAVARPACVEQRCKTGLRGIVLFTDALRYHAAVLAFWGAFPAPRVPRGPRLWASVASTEGKEDAHRLPPEACLKRAAWRVCRD